MNAMAMEITYEIYGKVFRVKPQKAEPAETYGGNKERCTEILYAEKRLDVWAKWSKKNRQSLGYPTISTLYKAMKERAEPIRMTWRVAKLKPEEIPPMLTAQGNGTRSMIPQTVEEAPIEVREVEAVVIRLPNDLHAVVIADYFTYGPIEVRAAQTKWKRARYSQLLESAKYFVFAALDKKE